MIEAVKILETCDVPVRWLMIDDGYLNADNRRLLNFLPNEKKFPNGWNAITKLKHPDRIRWMGLWRHMMGYMSGTSSKHTMDIPKEHLFVNGRGNCVVPNGTPEASMAYYEEMAKQTKAGGFDFTKVDFQSRSLLLCKGLDNPIRAMHYNNMALEEMTKKHLDGLLNCIAQTHINSLNTKYSTVTRSSRDYFKNKFNKAITYQSFANHLWMGQTSWGDMDMFHSHGEDGKVMAKARAIAGGPIYFSDHPAKVDTDVLVPV